jgi:hypothetical protein
MEKIKFLILFIFLAKLTFATGLQINPKPEPLLKETRNNFGFGVIYSDKGYGLSGGYYKSLSRSSDLFINLSITGISDTREFEYFDYYGNSYIQDKINRVFMLPLNIGMQHYLFKDDIENEFKPLLSIGITPALVLTNPYDKSYFKAFGYFNSAFAFGGFAGVGMEYQQSRSIAFSMNFRYFYLPVVSGSVISIKDSPMKDLGGVQLVFGVNFLK